MKVDVKLSSKNPNYYVRCIQGDSAVSGHSGLKEAKENAAERNAKAETLGIKTRYDVISA